MSLLADLVESLRQKLAESDSALKTTQESFLNWHREADKEFHSVFQKPNPSEQDIISARKKFHYEEMQKRRELEPAYEKRDQIKKELDSKIEWLNKGYEILNSPIPQESSQPAAIEEQITSKPSEQDIKSAHQKFHDEEMQKRKLFQERNKPETKPEDVLKDPTKSQEEKDKALRDFQKREFEANDKQREILKDPTKSPKEKAIKDLADKAKEFASDVKTITSASGSRGEDGKSGSPGRSYMPAGSNLNGKNGQKGKKGKNAKKKDKSKQK